MVANERKSFNYIVRAVAISFWFVPQFMLCMQMILQEMQYNNCIEKLCVVAKH